MQVPVSTLALLVCAVMLCAVPIIYAVDVMENCLRSANINPDQYPQLNQTRRIAQGLNNGTFTGNLTG